MTREQALAQADKVLLDLVRSGDAALFDAAGGDPQQVALAAMRAREELADQILAGEN